MKKLLSILFTLISFAAFAQPGSLKQSGYFTRVLDTATYQTAAATAHSQGYSDMYWNAQATTEHMDIWNGSAYVHVFDFNGGGGGGGTWGSITGTLSDQTDLQTALNLKAPLASPTFTGTVIIPTPFTLGATSVTSTGTQLNYLNAATGTTGTASTNLVYSTSPTLVTPALGTPSAVVLTNATGMPWSGIISTPTTLSGYGITDAATEIITNNTQTADYTLVLTDADTKAVVMNITTTSNSVTVPPNASVAFPVGTQITVLQKGTGPTSIVAGSGVTIASSSGTLLSPGQDSPMVLWQRAANDWELWNGTRALTSSTPVNTRIPVADVNGQYADDPELTYNSTTDLMNIGRIVLSAGSASSATAPIVLTSGTVMTIPEAGAVEFDGTNYFVTSSTTRYTLSKSLTNTATLNFDLTAVNYQDLTITVTGAADGDAVYIGVPNGAVVADVTYFGWVSATNTVSVRCSRVGGGGAADPASGTFRASVIKY